MLINSWSPRLFIGKGNISKVSYYGMNLFNIVYYIWKFTVRSKYIEVHHLFKIYGSSSVSIFFGDLFLFPTIPNLCLQNLFSFASGGCLSAKYSNLYDHRMGILRPRWLVFIIYTGTMISTTFTYRNRTVGLSKMLIASTTCKSQKSVSFEHQLTGSLQPCTRAIYKLD
jgi:hypothetical protein